MSAAMSAAPVPLFDLAAGWAALSPDIQAKFGMAALAIGLGELAGSLIENDELTDQEMARITAGGGFYDIGIREGRNRAAVLVDVYVVDGTPSRLQPPDLAAIEVRQCHGCGCTEANGPRGGTTWAGALVCTACAGHPPAEEVPQ